MNIAIKPTYRCNFNCRYCYVHDLKNESSFRDMTAAEAKQILASCDQFNSPDEIMVKWHGGEPLIMGVPFFEEIFRFEDSLNTPFQNAVFTNLTLLDVAYLSLFQKYHVHIFTSLDTIIPDHDNLRNGHCDLVMQKLDFLASAGYTSVTIKSTITSENVNDMFRMYEYFKTLPFEWNFAPVFPAGKNQTHTLSVLPCPETFSEMAKTIFDDWADTNAMDIYLFKQILTDFMTDHTDDEVGKPMFNVDPFGNVYRCMQMHGNEAYILEPFQGTASVNAYQKCDCEWSSYRRQECEQCRYTWICKLNHCSFLGDSMKELDDEYAKRFCNTVKPLFSHMYQRYVSEINAVNSGK